MASVMMKCGHASNAVDGDGNPACVICSGIRPGARVVDDSPPVLTERLARCAYYGQMPSERHPEGPCNRERCKCEKPSSPALAFFEHTPTKPFDNFYCGCSGWD